MKQYKGEKAIISLTSWKKRIKYASKTIYSLLTRCPGFHIVLVLSEEEFQKKEELPTDLMSMIECDLIELLWVNKNYKSFKKFIFTADKYRDVPIISADDGCFYTENFAEQLYALWLKNKNCICAKTHFRFYGIDTTAGCRGVLYPPYCFKDIAIKLLTDDIIATSHDDAFIGVLAHKLKIQFKFLDPLNVRKNNFCNIDECEKYGITRNKLCDNIVILQFLKKFENVKLL